MILPAAPFLAALAVPLAPVQGPAPTYTLSRNLYDVGPSCAPLYGEKPDADHDGLCDRTELELARRAAPLLKLPGAEPLLSQMKTLWQVHNGGRGEVIVTYVQTYVADLKSSRVRVAADHPGDSETVRYWLLSKDGGRLWRIVRAHYFHHKSGQDWAERDSTRTVALETTAAGGGVHPVVWVQQNAHGSYLDRETCTNDPEGDGDACSEGLHFLAPLSARTQVGEPDAHILGDASDPAAFTRIDDLGFPGESPWDERRNGFGVRGFCGGLPGTGLLGTTAQVAGEPVAYRKRLFAAVCAGPLAAQWDRAPQGTEDIIYWQGTRSTKVASTEARPAAAAGTLFFRVGDRLRAMSLHDGRAFEVPGVHLAGDPAATALRGQAVLAYARARDGRVVVRGPDGNERPTPLRDPEVALTTLGERLVLLSRDALVTSDDGGTTFSPPVALPLRLPERPAIAPLGQSLLLAYRSAARRLEVRLLGGASWHAPASSPIVLAARTEVSPWTVTSAFDGGAVYVFGADDHARIRYYKIFPEGRAQAAPVELSGSRVRSAGTATADPTARTPGRLVLLHDGDGGLFTRIFSEL